jgi:hypothetical protein
MKLSAPSPVAMPEREQVDIAFNHSLFATILLGRPRVVRAD